MSKEISRELQSSKAASFVISGFLEESESVVMIAGRNLVCYCYWGADRSGSCNSDSKGIPMCIVYTGEDLRVYLNPLASF